jgi:ribosomal protein S6--L-glutamate ligase
MMILILATSKPSQHLIDAIEKKGHSYYWLHPKDCYLLVSESINGYDRLYQTKEDQLTPSRILLKNFDAVIARIGSDLDLGVIVLNHLVFNLGLYCPQIPFGLEYASDKMTTTQMLSQNGVRVPATVFAKNPIHVDFLINKVGGLPAVGKTIRGSQGTGVFILKDAEQTNTSLGAMYHNEMNIILQKYIDANATDIRAIVVGDKVVASMQRQGIGSFKANLSQGGSGSKIELSKEDQELAVKASHSLGLDFSGVDLMKDSKGTTYCIEVNGNPGTKSINITGINWFKNLVELIETSVNLSNSTKPKDSNKAEYNLSTVAIYLDAQSKLKSNEKK